MPITSYQSVIKSRLETMFQEGKLYTETLWLQYSERDFIVELCILNGYCPVFGQVMGDYCSFNGIKLYGQQ
jgi:hypothetical protein